MASSSGAREHREGETCARYLRSPPYRSGYCVRYERQDYGSPEDMLEETGTALVDYFQRTQAYPHDWGALMTPSSLLAKGVADGAIWRMDRDVWKARYLLAARPDGASVMAMTDDGEQIGENKPFAELMVAAGQFKVRRLENYSCQCAASRARLQKDDAYGFVSLAAHFMEWRLEGCGRAAGTWAELGMHSPFVPHTVDSPAAKPPDADTWSPPGTHYRFTIVWATSKEFVIVSDNDRGEVNYYKTDNMNIGAERPQ